MTGVSNRTKGLGSVRQERPGGTLRSSGQAQATHARRVYVRSSRGVLLLFFGWRIGGRRGGGWRVRRARLVALHPFLEAANALAQAAHHVRNPAPAEKDQHDHQDDQKMRNAQRFHSNPSFAFRAHLATLPDFDARGIAPVAQSITRSSPTRRVTRSRSRYSSRGMAYLRVMPVSSLNAGIGRRSPRCCR